MRNSLGISAINWANEDEHLFPDPYSGDEILREMSELGYEGTEMSRKFPNDTQQLKYKLQANGLKLTSGWKSVHFSDPTKREEEMESYKKHVDFLKAMGCNHVVTCEERDLHHGPNENRAVPLSDEEWGYLVEGLHEAGRYCEQQGMELIYHFHGQTVVETPEQIEKLMNMTDPNLVHLLYDTGHAYYGGNDPLQVLKKYSNRIRYVHLKDVRKKVYEWVCEQDVPFLEAVKEGVFTVPGDGCIDFASIFQELHQQNYNGWLIVEAEQNPVKENPYQYALEAKHYIDKLMVNNLV